MEKPSYSPKMTFEEFLEKAKPSKASSFPGLSQRKQIGTGSFGKIYEIYLENDRKKKFAAKEVYSPDKSPKKSELSKESLILQQLSESEGFPRVASLMRKEKNEILIMTLLGSNLTQLCKDCGGKFSLKTVLMIGLQAIKRLEALHEKGFLHRDIKPENFVVGLGDNKKIIHLIDFGLSIPYLNEKGKHVKFNDNLDIGGTPYFLSSFGHLGLQPSRRDDLISLGYMLVHLFNGKLPWHDLKGTVKEKIKEMGRLKGKTLPKELCIGLPEEFSLYFTHVFSLRFQEKPDYHNLCGVFEEIMTKKGYENDYVFDWSNLRAYSGIDLDVVRMPHEPLSKYMKVIEDSDEDLNLYKD